MDTSRAPAGRAELTSRLRQRFSRELTRLARVVDPAEQPSHQHTIQEPTPLEDLDPFTLSVCSRVKPYTLTSPERIAGLVEAVRYVVRADVPGALVECGVWRGGSALTVLLTLLDEGVTDRDVWLYDTFEAMPPPGDRDVDMFGTPAAVGFKSYAEDGPPPGFEWLPFDQVRGNLLATGYPEERIHFVKGLVEATIPSQAPDAIALLRLDTDWYESTLHEFEHLFPRVPEGGVLLVDDYGHWMGAKQATDEYLAKSGLALFLQRVDYTARMAVVRR